MARRAVSPHCFPALFRRMIFPLDVLPIETSYCASGTLFSHRRVTWRNSACSATIFSVFDRGAPPNANEWRSCVDYLRTCLAGRPFDMPRPHVCTCGCANCSRSLSALSAAPLSPPSLSRRAASATERHHHHHHHRNSVCPSKHGGSGGRGVRVRVCQPVGVRAAPATPLSNGRVDVPHCKFRRDQGCGPC